MGVIPGRVAVFVVCLTIASGAPPARAQEGQALPEPSAAASAPVNPAPDPAPAPEPAPVPAQKPKPAALVAKAQVTQPVAAAQTARAPVASSSRAQPVHRHARARHQARRAHRRTAARPATTVIPAPRPSFPRPVPASSGAIGKPHDDLGRRLTLAGLALLALCTASAALLLSVVRLERARPGG
jgi:hypothetical protein